MQLTIPILSGYVQQAVLHICWQSVGAQLIAKYADSMVRTFRCIN